MAGHHGGKLGLPWLHPSEKLFIAWRTETSQTLYKIGFIFSMVPVDLVPQYKGKGVVNDH